VFGLVLVAAHVTAWAQVPDATTEAEGFLREKIAIGTRLPEAVSQLKDLGVDCVMIANPIVSNGWGMVCKAKADLKKRWIVLLSAEGVVNFNDAKLLELKVMDSSQGVNNAP
jgi:hypothetical protein